MKPLSSLLCVGISRPPQRATHAAFATAVIGALIVTLVAPISVSASVDNWHKGVSIISDYEEQFRSGEFQQSIDDVADTGATHVTLVLEHQQDGKSSSDIYRHWRTPNDEVLRDAVDYIHSQGMDVVFKIHLDLESEEWRAHIDPNDRDAWYDDYEGILMNYAQIAQEKNVDGMIIGSELISVASSYTNPDNEWRWRGMIDSVRGVYDGWLTYNANWGAGDFYNEKKDIEFWDALDYIGISAYYPLSHGSSVSELKEAWDDRYDNDIRSFIEDNGNKQYLFSEVGYRSVEGANHEPWDGWGDTSQQQQADLYRALFEYWDQHDRMKGVSFWHWEPESDAGGSGNRDFTPQNKQAEEVMTEWFSRGDTGDDDDNGDDTNDDDNGDDNGDDNNGDDGDDGTSDATFSISGDDADLEVNQASPVTITVTNTGDAITNGIVDLEIYNEDGTNVFQEHESGQSFSSGQQRSYEFTWTPESAGEYSVRAGIFDDSWSVYTWNNDVATLSVDATEQNGPAFTFDATLPGEATAGAEAPIDLAVENGGGDVTHTIVDLEVYNEQGDKVWQDYRRWQWFDTSERNTYTFDWMPASNGTYTIKAGVFAQNWANLLGWHNQLGTIEVSGDVDLPDSVELDFPTDGDEVTGEKTFRARLPGVQPSVYTMHWQVDGGSLVTMGNADDGFKRAFVDVSGWDWDSDNQYTITYVVKDGNGNTVTDRSIDILAN